jgi:hypothetical protein
MTLREELTVEIEWLEKQTPNVQETITKRINKPGSGFDRQAHKEVTQQKGGTVKPGKEFGPLHTAQAKAFIQECKRFRKESGLSDLP